MKYDFFIAGRWRNKDNVKAVLDVVRASGKSAYCFIENTYEGEKVEFRMDGNADDSMKKTEAMSQTDPFIQKIFETDMQAEKNSEHFILVLPAGIAGHVEAGVAYGAGKKCYAIGKPEKTETLYCIFEEIFEDAKALSRWLERH
ncbi:MAG: hypothetical protein ACM3MA_02040 [Acidobacteriota bacterium]